MNCIISAAELNELQGHKNLKILDSRTGNNAYNEYLSTHIKGALYIDLNQDLAKIPSNPSNGGRHPLPNIFDFAKTLSDLGIAETDSVVVYDNQSGANAAARCWWMLLAFGLKEVKVLDGGLQSAIKQGIELGKGEEKTKKSVIKIPDNWLLPLVEIAELEKALENNTAQVIDVRDTYRYSGDSEPIDLIAGHIPNAENFPFQENLTENGYFLSKEILKEKYCLFYQGKPEKKIFHCGSGVTACHSILAICYAGFPMPYLYVGSWSEWSRRGKPIEKYP